MEQLVAQFNYRGSGKSIRLARWYCKLFQSYFPVSDPRVRGSL